MDWEIVEETATLRTERAEVLAAGYLYRTFVWASDAQDGLPSVAMTFAPVGTAKRLIGQ